MSEDRGDLSSAINAFSERVERDDLAFVIQCLHDRLARLEAAGSILGFCPFCFRDCIVVDDHCHRCDRLLRGYMSLPVNVQLPVSDRVAQWSPGDPGTPMGTAVAVDGDRVTIEVGGAAVEVFREVVE